MTRDEILKELDVFVNKHIIEIEEYDTNLAILSQLRKKIIKQVSFGLLLIFGIGVIISLTSMPFRYNIIVFAIFAIFFIKEAYTFFKQGKALLKLKSNLLSRFFKESLNQAIELKENTLIQKPIGILKPEANSYEAYFKTSIWVDYNMDGRVIKCAPYLIKEKKDKGPDKKYFGYIIKSSLRKSVESPVYVESLLGEGKLPVRKMWFKKTINLVDPKFKKYFNVYSDDQILSRFFINPAEMEELKEFKADYPFKIVYLLSGDKQYIAVSDKNDIITPARYMHTKDEMLDFKTEMVQLLDKLNHFVDLCELFEYRSNG